VGSGGLVLLSIRLYPLPKSLILSLLLLGILLLLLKNGRCFGGVIGGFRRLMPLVRESPAYRGQSREDGKQEFRIDRFQHGVSD
jgi:hypothetical protein